jgi:hypothetical protein
MRQTGSGPSSQRAAVRAQMGSAGCCDSRKETPLNGTVAARAAIIENSREKELQPHAVTAQAVAVTRHDR